MKKFILIFCICCMLLTYFSCTVAAIDATPEWNPVPAIMIGDSFSSLAEQPLYSTAQEVSAGSAFNISIPLAGDDWQIDPTQPIEVRFMLMMVSGTNNYNTGSKKLKNAYFSTNVQGSSTTSDIISSDYTEYSYAVAFDPAEYQTGGGVSGGLSTEYVETNKGIYTGRGYFFDVVVNANAFTGDTPKSIQFDVTKFTTQTSASTYIFCPYVAVRNIIPSTNDYLIEILEAISNLSSNGGLSQDQAKQAIIEAINETLQSTEQENAAAADLADQIADNVLEGESIRAEINELFRPEPDDLGNQVDIDNIVSPEQMEEFTNIFSEILEAEIVRNMLIAGASIALISLVLFGKKG